MKTINNSSNSGKDLIKHLHIFYSKAFEYLNEHVFNSLLPNVGLTLQFSKTKKSTTKGYFKPMTFNFNDKQMPVICLVLDYIFDDSPYHFLDVLIHEMIHFEAKVRNISDTNNKGKFHNNLFKGLAESRGYMILDKDPKIGYSHGRPSYELEQIFNEFLKDNPFPYEKYEVIGSKDREVETIPRTSYKYICESCLTMFKAKKGLKIICADCDMEFDYREITPEFLELIKLAKSKG